MLVLFFLCTFFCAQSNEKLWDHIYQMITITDDCFTVNVSEWDLRKSDSIKLLSLYFESSPSAFLHEWTLLFFQSFPGSSTNNTHRPQNYKYGQRHTMKQILVKHISWKTLTLQLVYLLKNEEYNSQLPTRVVEITLERTFQLNYFDFKAFKIIFTNINS